MQPILTLLPYYSNAALEYFNALANQPWAILLHSGSSTHRNSRYDILVAEPEITLTTHNGVTEVCHRDKRELYYSDPFKLVQHYLRLSMEDAVILPRAEIPFLGGAVGYFGYDLAHNIEKLPKLAQRDVFLPEMAIGIYRWALIIDHYCRTVTLLSYDNPTPLLAKLNNKIPLIPIIPFRLTSSWRANMTRAEYGKKFRQIQRYLLDGECYQICLAQRFSSSYSGNAWSAFRLLLQYNLAPFSAFIRLKGQAVISLSPERFLYLKSGRIQSCPIKGTIPRAEDTNADLQQIAQLASSAKDQAENLMIVDLIRNDIGRVALPGSIRVPSLFAIETFAKVHHMVSTITAVLSSNYTPCDLLRSCFPGGSITGMPKVRAMELIEDLEPNHRSVWCGSIGYISYCGSMDTNIAIRTLLLSGKDIYCYVGGGIVANSNEELEYQETLAKASSILPVLENICV